MHENIKAVPTRLSGSIGSQTPVVMILTETVLSKIFFEEEENKENEIRKFELQLHSREGGCFNVHPKLLIGADGINSTVRTALQGRGNFSLGCVPIVSSCVRVKVLLVDGEFLKETYGSFLEKKTVPERPFPFPFFLGSTRDKGVSMAKYMENENSLIIVAKSGWSLFLLPQPEGSREQIAVVTADPDAYPLFDIRTPSKDSSEEKKRILLSGFIICLSRNYPSSFPQLKVTMPSLL